MAHEPHNPLTHPEVRNASTGLYVAAFVLGMVALGVGCLVTVGLDLSQISTLTWLAVIAAVASVGQLYLLFKLDLSRAMWWHTVSLVLTIPLFFMAVGLTMFMFHYLDARVMIGS